MVTPEEFRKALGKTGEGLSEQEIIRLNEKAATLADLLFNTWYESLKKKDDSKEE